MIKTIFLSSVSSEFGPMRKRLAVLSQRTKKCLVRHQDDFFDRGVKTLQMLVEEIEASDVVVHLIGAEAGWCVPKDQAELFLQQHPEFSSRFSEAAEHAVQGELPATQWEAWLGLYFRKRLCKFQLIDTPNVDPLQVAHVERLIKHDEHPIKPEDRDALFDEIVLSLIRVVFSEDDLKRPINLPYRSIGTLFTGRDQFLEQLRDSLQKTDDHRATAITGKALHGLGGVGKTRLALEYAWQHEEQYTAVLFVTSDSQENLRRNLAELTGPMVMDLAEQSAQEEEVRVAAALRWLRDHPGWFLILDNVDTEAAVDAVEQLLASLHGGQVLITSRLSRFSDVVEPLELDVLMPEDGAAFLLEKTKPAGSRGRKKADSDNADALELSETLGGLALAMEQAGAYIIQMRISLAEYTKLWRSHEANVDEWRNNTVKYAGPSDPSGETPQRTIAITWHATLDELGQSERDLLNQLAWFAPDPVRLSIFASADMKDVASEFEFRECIANLADFSMLQWDIELGTVTVHRVVQEILRYQQQQPVDELQSVLQLVQSAVPDGDPADVRTWAEWEPLRAHVAHITAEADKRDIATPTSALMGLLGSLNSAMALHTEAEQLELRALKIDEKHFGKNSTEAAIRLNNLAQTLRATNRLEERSR